MLFQKIFRIGIFTAIFAAFFLQNSAPIEGELFPIEISQSREFAANSFLPDLPELPPVERPSANFAKFADKFDARNLEVSIFANDPMIDLSEIQNCKSVLERTLSSLPNELTASLDEMELYFSRKTPRGLANSHLVELRCADIATDELVAVFVHELGHVVDLGHLRGESLAPSEFVDGKIQIAADDPSVAFYRLSWRDESTKKRLAERRDFVSGYAMSDPFEDFAETFNFFVLHGADFRKIKKESPVLAAKYNFFKNVVFGGVEFDSTLTATTGKRVWDATLVAIDRTEFFARRN